MKTNTATKILIIILIVFFSFKTLSEIAFMKGTGGKKADTGDLEMSVRLFPPASEHHARYGSALLDRYKKNTEEKTLERGRDALRKAIALNNLDFNSHFLLGKSFLAGESGDPAVFEKGLRLIRNATRIRRTNAGINIEAIKIHLSLWPFLDNNNKESVIGLMRTSAPQISGPRFGEIMETWGFYSKDPAFLPTVLNQTGRNYPIVLTELLKHELEMGFRHKLLAESEYFILQKAESDIIKFTDEPGKAIVIYNNLNNRIKGYYRLNTESRFREAAFTQLKKELLLRAIGHLLEGTAGTNVPQILSLTEDYLDHFDSILDIEILEKLLKKKNFFNSNDLKVFYLQQLINFRSGQVARVIDETETFRQSVTFIKEGQEQDLKKILILLTDAYIHSRLLTKAMETLREVEKISPGELATFWRLIGIEDIIGEDDIFRDVKQEKYLQIQNSNQILIRSADTAAEVYPHAIESLVLNLDESFTEKMEGLHLLQVFINGRIFHEAYLGGLAFPLSLPLLPEWLKTQFDVEVKLR